MQVVHISKNFLACGNFLNHGEVTRLDFGVGGRMCSIQVESGLWVSNPVAASDSPKRSAQGAHS
jgi:hypothetical protein